MHEQIMVYMYQYLKDVSTPFKDLTNHNTNFVFMQGHMLVNGLTRLYVINFKIFARFF